jgi:hypothetical protein
MSGAGVADSIAREIEGGEDLVGREHLGKKLRALVSDVACRGE